MSNIDTVNFYNFFSIKSNGFTADPEPLLSHWNDISNKTYPYKLAYSTTTIVGFSEASGYIYRDDSEEEKKWRIEQICKNFNKCTKNFDVDLGEIVPSDSMKDIARKILNLTYLIRAKDKFIDNENFTFLLDKKSKSEYLTINREENHVDDLTEEEALSRATNLFQMTISFYERLTDFTDPVLFATEHKESIIKFFTGRNIRLVTGEFDHETVRKLLKKHFGRNLNSSRTRIYTPLIIQLLSRNQTQTPKSTNTNIKGHELKLKISETYKNLGYNVTITKHSGDFGIDIIAESNTEKIGVQCKNLEATTVGVDAVMQAYSGGKYYDCTRYCVITNSDFTEPARELANKLGVEILTYNKN